MKIGGRGPSRAQTRSDAQRRYHGITREEESHGGFSEILGIDDFLAKQGILEGIVGAAGEEAARR